MKTLAKSNEIDNYRIIAGSSTASATSTTEEDGWLRGKNTVVL